MIHGISSTFRDHYCVREGFRECGVVRQGEICLLQVPRTHETHEVADVGQAVTPTH